MMIEKKFLYVTADTVGGTSGGSQVTWHESQALSEMGTCEVIDRKVLDVSSKRYGVDPWCWDEIASRRIEEKSIPENYHGQLYLAHLYAGTFGKTVQALHDVGCKCVYTAAAHNVEVSKREHLRLGLSYDYPHLTDPELLKRYLAGYLAADVVVCPSQHSASVMRELGRVGRIEIIPHGVNVPDGPIIPSPARFTVGYLGSYGPDKGVRYLLEAWKKLNYRDAVLLLAGRDSTSPFVQWMVNVFGGGNITMLGWQENVSDFYNQLSLYVQPSASEGWGCEVTEAKAHGRLVICSDGAGAADCVGQWATVPACNADAIAGMIDQWRGVSPDAWADAQVRMREEAKEYEWSIIRERYKQLWKGLIK